MGHWWKDTDRKKPYMPLCPPQIPHGQAWKQTRASTMTRRQVTTSLVAQGMKGQIPVLRAPSQEMHDRMEA